MVPNIFSPTRSGAKLEDEPWEDTYRPVYALILEGPQMGDWQYALLNLTPRAANLSILGVLIVG